MLAHTSLALGVLFALAAGLTWGLVFVVPLLLPDYSPALLSVSRYLAFGLIALPLAWWDRAGLQRLSRSDWVEALKLSLVGNLVYYGFLAAALQCAGGPLPTMIIGTLPVVIAVVSNLRAHRGPVVPGAGASPRLPWRRLLAPLALILLGVGLVHEAEWSSWAASAVSNEAPATAIAGTASTGAGHPDALRYGLGALLAVAATACWTWYPLRNAAWLRAHGADRHPRTWATAQGLATLPLAAVGFGLCWGWSAASGSDPSVPWGPTPGRFIGLMLVLGLLASWLGTLCWNEASQRLPTTLAGTLIVFETLAALAYAFILRGQWPGGVTLAGIACLVLGVAWTSRVQPAAAPGPG